MNTKRLIINGSIGGGKKICRTIKAQYWKNSLANFIRQDGLGATAVIELIRKDR